MPIPVTVKAGVRRGFLEEGQSLEALKNLVGERGFEPLTPCL